MSKTALGRGSRKAWIAIAVVLAAATVVLALNNRPYAVLAAGLTMDGRSAVMGWLEGQGVQDYRLEGDRILVLEGQETNLKARMIRKGLPESGCLYDTSFDSANLLFTESQRERAFVLALQDRLSAVLGSFDGVESACVNIAAETAEVSLTMEPERTLSQEQAGAVWNMVSHSVQGLSSISMTVENGV